MPQLLVVSAESSCHSTLVSHQRHRAPRCWAAGEALQGPTCCCTASTLHAACPHAGCMVCREGSSAANSRHTPQLLSPSWQRPGRHRCPLNRQWTALSHTKGEAYATPQHIPPSDCFWHPAQPSCTSRKGGCCQHERSGSCSCLFDQPNCSPFSGWLQALLSSNSCTPRYQPAVATSTARVGPRCQCAPEQHQNQLPKQPKGLVGWYHVQKWRTSPMACIRLQQDPGPRMPLLPWPPGVPLQQPGPQLPRGGGRVGRRGQWSQQP